MAFVLLILPSEAPSHVSHLGFSSFAPSEMIHLRWLWGCGREAAGTEVRPGGGAEVRHSGSRRLEFGLDLLTVETGSEGQETLHLLYDKDVEKINM